MGVVNVSPYPITSILLIGHSAGGLESTSNSPVIGGDAPGWAVTGSRYVVYSRLLPLSLEARTQSARSALYPDALQYMYS